MAELTIVVPDLMALADLAIRDPLRWPVMNRVLARGRSLPSQGQPGEGFARALGLKGGVGGLARYCFLHDTGHLPEGGCARLDPVEVGVGPRGLFLRSASMPDLQREEADALILVHRQKMINNVKALGPLGIIHRCDIYQGGKFTSGIQFEIFNQRQKMRWNHFD